LIRLKKSPYLNDIDLVSVKLEQVQARMNTATYEAYDFEISCKLVMGATENVESEKKLVADKLATGAEF
jgi:hypothetical protein